MLPIQRIGTAVAVSVVVSAPAAARGQQPTLDPQRAVALVVTYADGRRAPLIVGTTTGGATTSTFPREPSWTPPANQLSVDAIKFECLRTTEGVRVAISVFRGSQRQQDEPIKTMLVTPAQSVTVDAELRAVGVQPVTLSVMPIVVPELRAPEVTVPSPQVEVAGVRVTTTPFSGYVITLRNRSTKAVRSIEIAPMLGGRVGQSTRRAGKEGQALIVPGATYQIVWQLSVGLSASGGVAPFCWIRCSSRRSDGPMARMKATPRRPRTTTCSTRARRRSWRRSWQLWSARKSLGRQRRPPDSATSCRDCPSLPRTRWSRRLERSPEACRPRRSCAYRAGAPASQDERARRSRRVRVRPRPAWRVPGLDQHRARSVSALARTVEQSAAPRTWRRTMLAPIGLPR